MANANGHPMQDTQASAIVVGRGPAGLTAAVALAAGGVDTILVGKRSAAQDNRTTALLAGSVTALTTLGVWELCRAQAAPLRTMRIVDDTGRLWRAPEVKFDAQEIGLDAFGHNIENRHLVDALERRAGELATLRVIDVDAHDYPQVAVTLCLKHSRPHRDTSTEFHTPSGPFTLVPLPGERSSLVWVVDPADADDLLELDDAALAEEVERACHSILGKIAVEPGRGRFPLTRMTARRFAAQRIALVGEAAHVIPPIGAQGLNLGLRDAAAIGELAAAARKAGRDIGGINLLVAYDTMRRADVGSRTRAVDLLNRTLLTDLLPAQGARGLGLYMLDRIGPLRRALMREGVAPRAAQPRLMRGEMP